MNRGAVLDKVIGRPWAAHARGPEAFDCWHLAAHIQRELYGRHLPDIAVPEKPSWPWMIAAIDQHPERSRWRLVPADKMGLVRAGNGALVLMARYDRPAHIGVWLSPERRIIHADARSGVVCESTIELHTKGWTRLRFYEPLP